MSLCVFLKMHVFQFTRFVQNSFQKINKWCVVPCQGASSLPLSSLPGKIMARQGDLQAHPSPLQHRKRTRPRQGRERNFSLYLSRLLHLFLFLILLFCAGAVPQHNCFKNNLLFLRMFLQPVELGLLHPFLWADGCRRTWLCKRM